VEENDQVQGAWAASSDVWEAFIYRTLRNGSRFAVVHTVHGHRQTTRPSRSRLFTGFHGLFTGFHGLFTGGVCSGSSPISWMYMAHEDVRMDMTGCAHSLRTISGMVSRCEQDGQPISMYVPGCTGFMIAYMESIGCHSV